MFIATSEWQPTSTCVRPQMGTASLFELNKTSACVRRRQSLLFNPLTLFPTQLFILFQFRRFLPKRAFNEHPSIRLASQQRSEQLPTGNRLQRACGENPLSNNITPAYERVEILKFGTKQVYFQVRHHYFKLLYHHFQVKKEFSHFLFKKRNNHMV